jgi:hypothetical protein
MFPHICGEEIAAFMALIASAAGFKLWGLQLQAWWHTRHLKGGHWRWVGGPFWTPKCKHDHTKCPTSPTFKE